MADDPKHFEGLVETYERILSQMQGHVFYCEDDEGVLRRWNPPRPFPRPQVKDHIHA